jgi:flagellar hook-associated protein 1 FlgK
MSVRGTFTTLSIGRNSLLAHRTALDTVGHNLANSGVEGYTRQRANYNTLPPTASAIGPLGGGVRIDSIQRMGQGLVERRLDQDASDQHEAQARLNFLSQMEVVYTDESWGVSSGMTAFFNSFRDLSRNPGSLVQRTEVLARGEDLARRFASAADRIETLRSDLDAELSAHAAEITQLSATVADLNREILDVESDVGVANDLRDQRQRVVRRIAELVQIRSHTDSQGHTIVQMSSGHTLVSGRRSGILTTEADPNNSGLAMVRYTDADGTKPADVTHSVIGGELGGKLNARDNISGDALDRLNQLAFSLVSEVNNQHQAGFSLAVGGNPPINAQNFFTSINVVNGAAQAIIVDPAMLADPSLIAASSTANGSPGNNENALALAALEDATIINGSRPHDNWSDQVRQIGDQVARARRDSDNYDARMEQSTALREALSGVSVDEELAELVKVQTAFEASAKVVTTADEVLQTILAMKR